MTGGPWQRPTQTELLIAKLRERRDEGKALELPEIMRLGIAQHGARTSALGKSDPRLLARNDPPVR